MKHILCFGDSLTWGSNPKTGQRFHYDERWTRILQQKLGEGYRVIEEGLRGRTTVYDDMFTPYQRYGAGFAVLPMILDSHSPLDLVILMLGTNDLQTHREGTAKTAAYGCGKCVEEIMNSVVGPDAKAPKVLLIAPPVLRQPKQMMEIAFGERIAESQNFAKYYQIVAHTYGAMFLDASQYIETSDIDGIHWDKESNEILATQLATKVMSILNT